MDLKLSYRSIVNERIENQTYCMEHNEINKYSEIQSVWKEITRRTLYIEPIKYVRVELRKK